ncbi:TRAP transporter small permease [Halomonas urumqiensis]|uniref:TRAP transporter small permease protein n=1 Tax=Halomonas urumqiensis TaxID=1684789 RepID=A0A2N7UQ80_9GAMM|nr:TRAP transporter small permease [Halomonas urumqiensis]PMR82571.1 TRAP transporter small permease [Halomonas urumqiensis]PTB01028.1 TRAP transporter small permease [Halomonas urumqiensis]GHE22899.1 ABC transporter permease [Halomonas urumqiensis]
MSQHDPTDEISFEGLDDDTFDPHEYGLEDFLTLGIFWLLALDVFLQFFSRYVLGNSIAWTEEMARYLLVMVGFLGSTMAVRKGSHIAVEFFYRYMPDWLGRLMSTVVDLINIAFFAIMAWITFKLADRTSAMMVSVDIPKSWLYYLVMVGFIMMLVRGVQVAIRHWRSGTSELLGTP